jgi:hypothetical protein
LKRILSTIIIIISFLFVGNGRGATYYVNTSTGGNGNDGTASNTPWRNTEYALQMLANGDTLNIVASKTLPDRGVFTTTVAGTTSIIIQGTSQSVPAYLASSKNVSHGATIESRATPGNLIANGDMEGWLSSSSLWGIVSGASTHAKETTIFHGGKTSMKIVRSGSSLYFNWDITFLPANTEYTFSYWHYEAQGSVRLKYNIIERDPAPDNYLQTNGTWSTTTTTIDPNDNSNGAWRQTTNTFTTNGAGTYRITINATNDGTYYFDDLSLVPTTATYAWVQHSGDIYKLTGYLDTVRAFSKCTNTAWTANGLDALQYVPKAASLAAMTAGQWWFESGVLYYYLVSGEAIADLHIEAGTGSGINGINIAHNYYNLNYINQYMGNNNGIYWTGTNGTGNFVKTFLNYSCGVYNTGTANVLNDYEGAYTFNEDIVEAAGGDLTVNRGLAHHSYDDGFFAILTGQLTLKYFVSRDNGLQGAADNSGIGVESTSAKLYAYNGTIYGNTGRGIQIGQNNGYEVKNVISWGSTADDEAWMYDATQQAKGTHTNNIFQAKNAAWTTHGTESTSDPLFISLTDYHLKTGSPAINKGTNWMSGTANVTDYYGNSVTDASGNMKYGTTADIGANEAYYGPTITLTGAGVGATSTVY